MRRKGPAESVEPAESEPPLPDSPVARPLRLTLGRDDEIAASVHEIQNALTSVLGWVEIARASGEADTYERALRVIETGVQRAQGLTARLGAPTERFAVRPRAFRVGALLAEVHELLYPRCMAAGVACRVETTDDELAATGDPDRVVQIVTNLVLNAVDAVLAVPGRHPPRGFVTLGARGDEKRITVFVRDDGTGMDDATRAKIFDPYFTTHPSAVGRRRAGTGLGLAVSRSLAEAMGGTLDVQSTLGAGTEATLTLVREGVLPSVKPPPDEIDELRIGTRVLVVDDEPAIRELLEVALALRGAAVTTAASLASARAALGAGSGFDVVLVDETLGRDESGAHWLVELHTSHTGLPSVLMTGAPSVDHLPAEACRWLLRKPFSLDDVVRLIRRAVDLGASRVD